MVRGMDERFENPSDQEDGQEDNNSKETTEEASTESNVEDGDTEAATEQQSNKKRTTSTTKNESSKDEVEQLDDKPLNIRKDWDSATIYVEPEQSEDIEITFTRLKKQLKREDITLEKNKHFYRGVFKVAFDEFRQETKEKIEELAKKDSQ